MVTLTKCASLHVRKSILIKQLRPLWSRFIVTIMYLTDGRHLLQDFLICLHQSFFFHFLFLQIKVHRNYVPLLNECLSRWGWNLQRDWFLLAIWKVYGHRMFDFFSSFFFFIKEAKGWENKFQSPFIHPLWCGRSGVFKSGKWAQTESSLAR